MKSSGLVILQLKQALRREIQSSWMSWPMELMCIGVDLLTWNAVTLGRRAYTTPLLLLKWRGLLRRKDYLLFHTSALQPKQELIGQALALMQRLPCIRYVPCHRGGIFIKTSDRWTFCLRLLLMCCNLSIGDWVGLIPADCVLIDIDEADDPVPPSNSLNPFILALLDPVLAIQKREGTIME